MTYTVVYESFGVLIVEDDRLGCSAISFSSASRLREASGDLFTGLYYDFQFAIDTTNNAFAGAG